MKIVWDIHNRRFGVTRGGGTIDGKTYVTFEEDQLFLEASPLMKELTVTLFIPPNDSFLILDVPRDRDKLLSLIEEAYSGTELVEHAEALMQRMRALDARVRAAEYQRRYRESQGQTEE